MVLMVGRQWQGRSQATNGAVFHYGIGVMVAVAAWIVMRIEQNGRLVVLFYTYTINTYLVDSNHLERAGFGFSAQARLLCRGGGLHAYLGTIEGLAYRALDTYALSPQLIQQLAQHRYPFS